MKDIDPVALRLAFLNMMLDTVPAKLELLHRLEAAPVHKLDRIYSGLGHLRKVRRLLIARYRDLSDGRDLDPVA